jgi:hypothetical protein
MKAVGEAFAAAGLIFLGITVCQGLLTYYQSWKDAGVTIKFMYEAMEALKKTSFLFLNISYQVWCLARVLWKESRRASPLTRTDFRI